MVFPPLFTVDFSYSFFILSSVLFHSFMFYVLVVYFVAFRLRGIKLGKSVQKVHNSEFWRKSQKPSYRVPNTDHVRKDAQ